MGLALGREGEELVGKELAKVAHGWCVMHPIGLGDNGGASIIS
jgi:hypothetical protein